MEQHTIIRLTDRPEYKESMAQWFHEKWGIPKQAYLDSMDACLKGESAVPQWYAVVEDGRIIGGLGVIENDFHDRKDLSPNVCAVYVEEDAVPAGVWGGRPPLPGHRRGNAALRLRGHEGQGRAGTVSGDRPYVLL